MDKKQLSKINKLFDLLYDLNSKYNLFSEQKNYIEEFMFIEGYKMKINNYDKCVFIKIKLKNS